MDVCKKCYYKVAKLPLDYVCKGCYYNNVNGRDNYREDDRMDDNFEYGKMLIINKIIEDYQELEGEFTEEDITHAFNELNNMPMKDLIRELGYTHMLAYDK